MIFLSLSMLVTPFLVESLCEQVLPAAGFGITTMSWGFWSKRFPWRHGVLCPRSSLLSTVLWISLLCVHYGWETEGQDPGIVCASQVMLEFSCYDIGGGWQYSWQLCCLHCPAVLHCSVLMMVHYVFFVCCDSTLFLFFWNFSSWSFDVLMPRSSTDMMIPLW